MYFERQLTPRLLRLISQFPIVVITGARQVGKSTFLRHALGERWSTVVFDPVVDIENARQDPDLFLDNRPPPLVLDEVQYAAELVPALKRRVDRDRRPGQYVLTGSQQWGVLRALAESLAGRVVFLDLEGFSLAEQVNATPEQGWLQTWLEAPELLREASRLPIQRTLYELLWRGSLPDACLLPLDVVPDFHLAYLRTYIERDARLLAEVSDWQRFGRFVGLCGALTAQEVNASQLGRDIGLSPQTARRWLDVLIATFQWFEIPAWSGNALKRVSGRPKGYLFDTGMAAFVQAISTPNAIGAHPLAGALFETAVVGEIRKQCAMMSPRPTLYHWRAHSGPEVDLLLERDGTLFPIEVKLSSRPTLRDRRGIQAFQEAYPRQRLGPGLILAPTERPIRLGERDWALPWDLAAGHLHAAR